MSPSAVTCPSSSWAARSSIASWTSSSTRSTLPRRPGSTSGRSSPSTSWPRAPTSARVRRKLLQENIVGFYDERPGKKQLYAVSEDRRFGPTNQLILVHELRHALQDQYVDLRAQLPDSVSDYDDRRLACMSLLEGDATLVMERFLLAGVPARTEGLGHLRAGDARPRGRAGGAARWSATSSSSPTSWAGSSRGRSGSGAAPTRSGPPGIGPRAPRSRPSIRRSTSRTSGPWIVAPPAGPPRAAVLAEGVLGELLMRTLLEGGDEAAAGWGGDAYRVFDTGAGTLLAWRTVVGSSGGCSGVRLVARRSVRAPSRSRPAREAPSPSTATAGGATRSAKSGGRSCSSLRTIRTGVRRTAALNGGRCRRAARRSLTTRRRVSIMRRP